VWQAALKAVSKMHVSVPLALLAGLFWLGFNAQHTTVAYLSEFFVSRAQAQDITRRVEQLEESVKGLGTKIDNNRLAQLEAQVFQVRIQQCMAAGTLRSLYADQISRLVGEWRILTHSLGNPPTLVECKDLG
jgi:hypothetical protein